MDVVERLKTRAGGFAGFSREAWAREDNHSEQRGSDTWVWDKPRMGLAHLPGRNTALISLTDEEKKCGWTAEKLEAYRRERDKAADVVSGNIVTEFKRAKEAVRIEGAGRNYSPFTRQVR